MPRDASAPVRLLVVEDEAIIARDLERRLQRMGCEVVGIADTGAGALAMALDTRPALVFMDIVLQGPVDGIDTAAALTRQIDVPVVFLTAHTDAATIERAKRVAPYGYLVKPFEERELHTTIEMVIQRHRIEAEARLLHHAVASATTGIAVVDVQHGDGTITLFNKAFERMTGYRADEVVGRPAGFLIGPGTDPAASRELRRTLEEPQEYQQTLVLHRKDGTSFSSDVSFSPVRDTAGRPTHVLCFHIDVTERLKLEAQLRQAQKMESVGQLVGGIAHDFNNLLTVINGMSQLILEQTGPDDPVHADVKEINAAGERAAMLTRQLLAFSRQQVLAPQVLNVDTAVVGMESLLRRVLGEDIDLVVVPAPDLGSVKADPGQLEQVLANLAVNARDAMPQGGHLTIETQNVMIDEAYARQHGAAVPPGPYVMLSVSDSGVGMDEATRARVFEPFFTTKGPGKGTGLGLSTVYGIVKQSHGFIWVYSEVGQGTTFKICLPQVTEAAGAAQPAPTVDFRSGTETILLVEDHAGLRQIATRFLEPAGYTVLGVASGEEALRLLAGRDAPVHLLLTDVVLPGMSGRHLAEQLAQTGHGGLPVLYMSGYTADTIVRHGVLDGQMSFLGKPFTAAVLLHKVRAVLDARA